MGGLTDKHISRLEAIEHGRRGGLDGHGVVVQTRTEWREDKSRVCTSGSGMTQDKVSRGPLNGGHGGLGSGTKEKSCG